MWLQNGQGKLEISFDFLLSDSPDHSCKDTSKISIEAHSCRAYDSGKRGLPPVPVEHKNRGGGAPSTFALQLELRGQEPVSRRPTAAKRVCPLGFGGRCHTLLMIEMRNLIKSSRNNSHLHLQKKATA